MPSLRRTISSPSVRSSPYPSALFTASAGARNQPSGHRRSSASETQTRRVLADIEWWKVIDGQQDVENGSAQEQEETAQGHGHDPEHPDVQDQVSDELWGFAGSSSEDAGVERPSTPLALTHFPPGSLEVITVPFGIFLLKANPCRRHRPSFLSNRWPLCLLRPSLRHAGATRSSRRRRRWSLLPRHLKFLQRNFNSI